jgi:Coenzyme PQQ synthesis protein D (PqqD)
MMDDLRIERTRFHVSQHVRASISGDGLVLLDVQGGFVLASNLIGARIWELVAQQLGSREIASHLAREFDVPVQRAYSDVIAFVTALEARGLVTEVAAC